MVNLVLFDERKCDKDHLEKRKYQIRFIVIVKEIGIGLAFSVRSGSAQYFSGRWRILSNERFENS